MKERITKRDVNVERTAGGYWRCSTVVNGHRVSCAFNGYTKRESLRRFVRDVNGSKGGL